MADAGASLSRCGRCGQPVVTRGGRRAAYCSVCGQRMAPPAANVEHRFEPAPNVEHRFRRPPAPPWYEGFAIVFGVLGLIPGCGLVFALLALALAFASTGRTDETGRRVSLSAAGQFAMLIAILGLVVQFFGCAMCRVVQFPRL